MSIAPEVDQNSVRKAAPLAASASSRDAETPMQ
eukprot:COSAG05_NODE_20095_length_283_cov_0.836957_1_plen_32_part_10